MGAKLCYEPLERSPAVLGHPVLPPDAPLLAESATRTWVFPPDLGISFGSRHLGSAGILFWALVSRKRILKDRNHTIGGIKQLDPFGFLQMKHTWKFCHWRMVNNDEAWWGGLIMIDWWTMVDLTMNDKEWWNTLKEGFHQWTTRLLVWSSFGDQEENRELPLFDF